MCAPFIWSFISFSILHISVNWEMISTNNNCSCRTRFIFVECWVYWQYNSLSMSRCKSFATSSGAKPDDLSGQRFTDVSLCKSFVWYPSRVPFLGIDSPWTMWVNTKSSGTNPENLARYRLTNVSLFKSITKPPWCNGYRRRKWTRWHEFKSWPRLIAFHIALIPLGKVWIQLFFL